MITVRELRFRYPRAEKETLRGLSLEIGEGEILGLLGPSGVGKSTFVKALIGILPGWQGEISFGGTPLKELGRSLYEELGVAFEFPAFYSKLTARENLRFFSTLYREETEPVEELLAQVGLAEEGEKRLSEYSKGMKTRLNLCRALLPRPRFLVLDEPTSGLDPSNAALVKELILRKKEEGVTILLTTHNMHVADELCDRVALMSEGSFQALDTPLSLKRRFRSSAVVVEFDGTEERYDLEGLATNPSFLRALGRQDFRRLRTEEASLEAVFLKLTGRGLDP